MLHITLQIDILRFIFKSNSSNNMNLFDLANQYGLNPKWVASTEGGEYHSSCPDCGGDDRFYIQPDKQMRNCKGRYGCRKCGTYGDSIKFAMHYLKHTFPEAVELVHGTMPDKSTIGPKREPFKISEDPPDLWINKATDFANRAYNKIFLQPNLLKYLDQRGLPLKAIHQYKLGYSDQDLFNDRKEWGLPEVKDSQGKVKQLWIPRGLIIPTLKDDGQILKLKVRRLNWKKDDKLPKYINVSGGITGLNTFGNPGRNVMVIVESELDAMAIHYAANDFVFAVAIGSNIKTPDYVTNALAKKRKLVICYDNDEGGDQMYYKWKNLYPHAIRYPTPVGKDIGEALQKGLNIRDWLKRIT